jgi:3-methylcrotonyl-CoA carboxylase beta subunit
MTVLQTQLNSRSADFVANAKAMQAVVDDLRTLLDLVGKCVVYG